MLETPVLTRNRIRLAYAVAVTADALQMVLGPLGWAFPDEVIDVAAMVLTVGAIGFHPLLLPTFVVEFIPLVDILPTWTACSGKRSASMRCVVQGARPSDVSQ